MYHESSRALLEIDEYEERNRTNTKYWQFLSESSDVHEELFEDFESAFASTEGFDSLIYSEFHNDATSIQYAWLMFLCMQYADKLQNMPTYNTPDVSLLGQTLHAAISNQMVIADLHMGNIGETERTGTGVKVITDPGLVMILNRALAEAEPEDLIPR